MKALLRTGYDERSVRPSPACGIGGGDMSNRSSRRRQIETPEREARQEQRMGFEHSIYLEGTENNRAMGEQARSEHDLFELRPRRVVISTGRTPRPQRSTYRARQFPSLRPLAVPYARACSGAEGEGERGYTRKSVSRVRERRGACLFIQTPRRFEWVRSPLPPLLRLHIR